MRVYLARHGETTWNVEARYQGQLDASVLTQRGEMQAAALAGAMSNANLHTIVSSPLRRCLATATFAADALALPVQSEPLLREIGHGTWEGLLKIDIAHREPQLAARWHEHPYDVTFKGGESLVDVRRRWRAFAERFAGGGPALVVTHDVLVRLALIEYGPYAEADFWSVPCTNGAYAVFEVVDGNWNLVSPCVDNHLDGLKGDPSAQAL